MKKWICMMLTFALVLGLCLPVTALSFTDETAIGNLDAVTVMVDLGLISGYEDGSFLPRNNIRRAEAAKLMALVRSADPKTAGIVSFSDVPASFWAAQYVAFCAEQNIIAGYAGKFRPQDFVTGREFAKMLLVCLGYDGGRYTGAGWTANVDTDAKEQGIYKDYNADPGANLSRDGACLLMYNAMQCYAVAGVDALGRKTFVTDQLMNPVTYMEHRFGVVKYAGLLEANEYADLTKPWSRLADGMSKLEGHSPFRVSTPYSFLGRMVEIYTVRTTVDGVSSYKVIGIPHLADSDRVFTTTDEDMFLLAQRFSGVSADSATQYYYNGELSDETLFGKIGGDCHITAVDRDQDNRLDAVMVTDFRNGTVIGTDPVTIGSGNLTLPGGFFDAVRPVQSGEIVRCAAIGGRFLVAD